MAFTQGVSGWRAVFGKKEDDCLPMLGSVALAASSFVELLAIPSPVVMVGMDTRPTSRLIAAAVVQSLLSSGAIVRFAGVVCAPEIMAASHSLDGFVFVTASHNPVEYNGLKFGRQGAVLTAEENKKLSAMFCDKCNRADAQAAARKVLEGFSHTDRDTVYKGVEAAKRKALETYKAFVKSVIGDVSFGEEGFSVLADFNGGARVASIDKEVFAESDVGFYAINDGSASPLVPVHGIVPEGENLAPLAAEMERLHKEGAIQYADKYPHAAPPVLGYMTDCDGDRGNIVYWDDEAKKARILAAQEVFALVVLQALEESKGGKTAVAVNCATSERIEEIAQQNGAMVVRCEVGEANVESVAEKARKDGYAVPVAGEGSNGGNITYPSRVRDPIMTVFAILRLLRTHGTMKELLAALPVYTTTGATEKRACLNVRNKDAIKTKFKEIFLREWGKKAGALKSKYGIAAYDVALTNGATERIVAAGGGEDWNNGAGGLKVRLLGEDGKRRAFLWMRASGTEDVFRVMCDVRGDNAAEEKDLLAWWTAMIGEADK